MQNLVSKKEEEERRLKALAEYRILGTKPESCYDDITKIAAATCNVPISLMTLVDKDRQWFKSKIGLQISETRRDWSFCTHAIKENSPLIIHDAFQDQRFINNPLVTGDPKIRFYAGFPLKTSDGNKLGTLCVIDRKPGNLTTQQFNIMELLSKQIVSFLELRKKSLNRSQRCLQKQTQCNRSYNKAFFFIKIELKFDESKEVRGDRYARHSYLLREGRCRQDNPYSQPWHFTRKARSYNCCLSRRLWSEKSRFTFRSRKSNCLYSTRSFGGRMQT